MRRTFAANAVRCALAAGLLGGLSACAAMEERADALFHRHHDLSSSLTEAFLMAEMEDRTLPPVVYDMEETLQRACGPLDRIANRRMQGEPVGATLQLAAFDALDECEAAVNQVDHALSKLEDGFAQAALTDDVNSVRP